MYTAIGHSIIEDRLGHSFNIISGIVVVMGKTGKIDNFT